MNSRAQDQDVHGAEGRWPLSYMVEFFDYSGFWATPRRAPRFAGDRVRRDLELMRALGLGWVFFSGVNPLDVAWGVIEEAVEATAAWLKEFELRVSSFHVAGPCVAWPGRPQEPVAERLIRTAEVFGKWQPRALVLHAGWIAYEPEDLLRWPDATLRYGEVERRLRMYEEIVRTVGIEALVAAAAQNLKLMARAAARSGSRLAFENMGGMEGLGDRETMAALVAAIGEPNVGYCLDSGHAWLRGEPLDELARWMGDRLYETHFHDNRGGDPAEPPRNERDEHLPPGFGTIDWRAVIQALDAIHFPGPVTFEVARWPVQDKAAGLRQAIAWWRACERLALGNGR